MPLATGSRLGPYEIQSVLGAGGMGEVYRARDTKLGRDVALKILPELFATDPDRLARFQREAQVLAALNHPNIGAIYGLEESNPSIGSGQAAVRALVLELVEGPTLADRIAQGAIPIEEALPIAKQIAAALEAAHEQGIVHRDLKPANIKLRSDGTVKVLDFGLAKLTERGGADRAGGAGWAGGPGGAGDGQAASHSPTITTPAMTQTGTILGTAAYMSPEQAKGRTADKRSDIWAFGSVLFEMLTGKRAFEGDDITDTLAAILRGDPNWSALPTDVPDRVVTFIKHCLAKDPRQRVSDTSIALYVLGEPSTGQAMTGRTPEPVRSARTGLMSAAAVGVMVGALVTAAAVWSAARLRTVQPARLTRFTILPPTSQPLLIQGQDLAISPDGTHIVYQAGTGPGDLMVRTIDELDVHPLGAVGGRRPFFSPDGRWIGFFAGATLKKVPITGGPSIPVCPITGAGRGGSWGPDGTIIFATTDPTTGLMSVSSDGGEPKVLTKPDPVHGEQDHVFPSTLPNGRAVLFTITHPAPQPENRQVAVLDLASGHSKPLIQAGGNAQYVDTGYLIYVAAATLNAVRFDAERLAAVGDARPVVEHVTTPGGAGDFAVSRQGTLVYVPEAPAQVRSLVWVDRQGREDPINAPPRTYGTARISADGTRLALGLTGQEGGLWIWDLARGTSIRLPSEPGELIRGPVWDPDNRRIIFVMFRGTGQAGLYRQAADGSGTTERLNESDRSRQPPLLTTSISRDGQRLFFTQAQLSIAVLSLSPSTREVRTLIDGRSSGSTSAEISPDVRWLAYESDESGRYEIYVRPFPNVDSGKTLISTSGGSRPAWSKSGRELFYLDASGHLTAVPVQTGATFRAGKPTKLFDNRYFGERSIGRPYDVGADGQRFLMIKEPLASDARATPPGIVVVESWTEELKAKVETK